MRKRILALLLCLMLTAGMLPLTAHAGSMFPDVPDNADYAWAAELTKEMGIFAGDDNGNFNPDQGITRAQCAAVSGGVYACGRAGNDKRALPGQPVGKLFRALQSIGRGLARADHSNGDLLVNNGKIAPDIEQARRLEDVAQADGIVRILHRKQAQPQPRAGAEDTVGLLAGLIRQQRGLARFQAGNEAVFVLIGIIDILRRAEMIEQRQL